MAQKSSSSARHCSIQIQHFTLMRNHEAYSEFDKRIRTTSRPWFGRGHKELQTQQAIFIDA